MRPYPKPSHSKHPVSVLQNQLATEKASRASTRGGEGQPESTKSQLQQLVEAKVDIQSELLFSVPTRTNPPVGLTVQRTSNRSEAKDHERLHAYNRDRPVTKQDNRPTSREAPPYVSRPQTSKGRRGLGVVHPTDDQGPDIDQQVDLRINTRRLPKSVQGSRKQEAVSGMETKIDQEFLSLFGN